MGIAVKRYMNLSRKLQNLLEKARESDANWLASLPSLR